MAATPVGLQKKEEKLFVVHDRSAANVEKNRPPFGHAALLKAEAKRKHTSFPSAV
jgi:hypothetical protein